MRTVEAEFVRNIARSCNLLEQTLPKPTLRPPVVTIVDRSRRAVFRRHVAPAASGLENVQDATDDTATSEVLRVIPGTPSELEPVFRAILANATRVCDAKIWQPVDPRVFVLPTERPSRPPRPTCSERIDPGF